MKLSIPHAIVGYLAPMPMQEIPVILQVLGVSGLEFTPNRLCLTEPW